MILSLPNCKLKLLILLLLTSFWAGAQTTTVFSDDFTASQGTTYTNVNGPIGASATWTMLRSGTDFGAGINGGRMVLSNDASGSSNASGWVLAYAATASFASPYTATLNSNAGLVTWTFNMRQNRANPSGPASGYYAPAFILAGSSGTTATAGTGYAIILGQSGSIDPIRLIRYTAGLRTSTNILTSNTSGLADFGNTYLSIKVTFAPATGTWQLFVRNDGSAFQDPETGTLTLQGSAVNTASTGTSLPLMGTFWNAGNKNNQTAYFDNVKVTVATPYINSLSPTSRVANSGAFTLTVNGSNFSSGSVIQWNGSNRTTTFVSATQLTASIPGTDIASSGTAAITVATGTAVSNSQTFTIDPPASPSLSTSTNVLAAMSTTTGTASGSQSFTVSGANLTADVIATAPANFEVSLNNTTFADFVTLTRTGNVLVGQPVTVYARVKASAPAGLYSNNITLTTSGGASKLVAVSATVLSAEPVSSAANVTFTNVTSSTFTINWTGVGTNHLVVVKQGSAATATPVDGTGYSVGTIFGQGADIGSASYVVYNGIGTSVTVSGLTAATAYYVAIYEFNGSGGTQNYRITSPATGNRSTINAPLGLQVTTTNEAYNINFDTTVDGVNNSQYDGGGVSAVAGLGELSSNSWAFTGFSGGNLAFGGSSPEDSSYENGDSTGGETDGGLYAFQVSENNFALGVQPATGEFAPGTITFRFQNQTGATITSLSIGYKVYVYNDQPGSSSFNFSHSANNSTYTTITALNETTTAAADAVPGWKAYFKVVTITGLSLASNSYYYLRWSGATVSGTVFDEIALDDISIVANPTTTFASFSGTAENFTVSGNANLTGTTGVNNNITFLNNSWLALGANTLTLSGAVTNTTTGGLRGSASSNLTVNGTTARTLSFDQTTAGTTNLLNSLNIGTSGTITTTLGNNAVVNGTLNVDAGQTFNLGTNTLTGTLATITNDGTVTTQNTTATPFASGKTWSGSGTLNLNAASAAQTLVAGTYNNVTVTTTGGATATGNVTVNGALNLPNANPSATKGAFDTGTFTLTLGTLGTNTGTGDVSGIVARNTILPNTNYTFGHPNTNIIIPPIGTLPTSLSLKTVLGQAPAGKTDGILRTYDFIQTGGGGTGSAATKAIIRAHYLDSELNGNTENKLVDWVVVVSPLTVIEQGRSNYSTFANYVELSNVNVSFFQSSFGQRLLTLANSQVSTATWNGSVSNSWTTAANWTPNAVPSDATNVIIPDAATTPNDPILNPTTTIGTLTIEAGGILDSPAGGEFTITGTTGAWINKGTFNPSTGTVTFNATSADATIAGNTTFNNLTIGTGTLLRTLNNNVISVAGAFTKLGTFITSAANNTFIYAGTNQTIVTPDGYGSYDNLIISGTGAVFPSTLIVKGNFTTNAAVNLSGTTLTLNGIDTGNQIIGGTVSPTFSNLIINRTTGNVSLGVDATVSGTLTLTSGLLEIHNFNLTLGSAAVAGSFSATTMIVADGTGTVRRPYTGTGSYFFPVGEMTSNTSYSPITINITSGTFNSAFVAVNVVDATHPNNQSTGSYLTRYWNVTQTGISNAVATVTGTFIAGDAVGGASTLAAAQLNGSFNQITNPWVKYGVLGATTLTATGAVLTSGQTSVFTGIAVQDVVVSVIGAGTFCQDDTVTLTTQVTGGTAPYVYEWSDGLGNASSAMPSTALVGNTTYTLTVRDANGIVATATADVTVSAAPVAGTLSGDQAICSGTTPSVITLSGYSGSIVRWERSVNDTFNNPSAINNTTATLSSAQIGVITSTRYFRAVVQNGSCPVVYTAPVAITVSSTTWNGSSWSNGLPTSSIAAVFSGNYTATGNINACSIQVTNNAEVIIPSGNTVTTYGAITVASGSFTLENNANLIQTSNVANTGNIIVKRNSSQLFRQDYTMWSTPVSGNKTLQEFSPLTLSSRFFVYDTANDQYNAANAAGTFTPGAGYLIRMPNGSSISGYNSGAVSIIFPGIFEGVPNNGNVVCTLSNSGNAYNLIGNPYPSPISIPAFLTANSGAIDGIMWIWRKKNNASSPNSAYITVNSTGQYVGNGEPEAEDPNGILRTAQGFIVRRTGTANVTFTNTMRSSDTSNQFFRMNNNNQMPESHGIWLNLTGPNNAFSQMYAGYIEGATQGEDNGIDARYINDSPIVLASVISGTEMIIQGRALPFAPADVVPLVLKTNTAGNYTITIDHVDGLFTGNQNIFIKDNLLNLTHNLKESAYAFATTAGTFTGRFEIVYMAETLGTDNPALTADEVIVYKNGKTLHITSGKVLMDNIEIFDTRGRLIYTAKNINTSSVSIDNLTAEEQMLIINIDTERGEVSKKVIY